MTEEGSYHGRAVSKDFGISLGELTAFIEGVAESQLGDRAALLVRAVRPLLPLCQAEGARMNVENGCYICSRKALQFLDDLQIALTSNGIYEPDRFRGMLWRHDENFPDFSKVVFDSLGVDKDALQQVAADYLALPWLSDGHIDWIIADALTRLELVEFDYAVEERKLVDRLFTVSPLATWLMGSGPKLVAEALIAAATGTWLWHEFSSQAPNRYLWATAVSAYYVLCAFMVLRARRVNEPLLRQRTEMAGKVRQLRWMLRKSYAELKGPVLHPTRVRDAFDIAEAAGVKWSSPIWSIFDNAIRRDPTVWLTGYSGS